MRRKKRSSVRPSGPSSSAATPTIGDQETESLHNICRSPDDPICAALKDIFDAMYNKELVKLNKLTKEFCANHGESFISHLYRAHYFITLADETVTRSSAKQNILMKAAKCLKHATSLSPNAVGICYQRANLLKELGHFDQAIQECHRGLSLEAPIDLHGYLRGHGVFLDDPELKTPEERIQNARENLEILVSATRLKSAAKAACISDFDKEIGIKSEDDIKNEIAVRVLAAKILDHMPRSQNEDENSVSTQEKAEAWDSTFDRDEVEAGEHAHSLLKNFRDAFNNHLRLKDSLEKQKNLPVENKNDQVNTVEDVLSSVEQKVTQGPRDQGDSADVILPSDAQTENQDLHNQENSGDGLLRSDQPNGGQVLLPSPGQQYNCFAYSLVHEKWVMYDEETVKEIGCWDNVLATCERERLKPQILFVEALHVSREHSLGADGI